MHPFYRPSRAPKISKPQGHALQRLLRLLGSDNSAHDAVQGLAAGTNGLESVHVHHGSSFEAL